MQPYSIYAFADEANSYIPGQIAAMKRNGLQGLEIRNVGEYNIVDITLEMARQVREQLTDAGLLTWSIGSPIGKKKIDADFAPELERFKHTLELAHELGAGNIRLFSFYMPKEADPAIYRNEVIDRMGQFVEAAHGSGIFLCHENAKGIYGDIADRCLDLHRQLPELKGVFDPANFVQCGDDTLRGWEMLKDYTYYLHIKDALPNGDVVPAGKGAGNVAYIVKAFLAGGGKAMTVEPHLRVFTGLSELEENGNTVGNQFAYPTTDDAFDAACNALKDILEAL